MTMILYSEGLLDLGDTKGEEIQGPLRHLIQGVLGHPDGLIIESRKLSRVHSRAGERRRLHGMSAYGRKVYRAIRDAEIDQDDGIAVVLDRDGEQGIQRLDRLQEGRARARSEDDQQANQSLPCALGVAQEMVESWLMGDAGAWPRAFGGGAPEPPRDPEVDTAARGSSRYAKQILQTLLEQAGQTADVQGYSVLAEHIDTVVLEATCHRSFKPFADDLRREIAPLYGRAHR